jgi:parallel beta-helix repeat protein
MEDRPIVQNNGIYTDHAFYNNVSYNHIEGNGMGVYLANSNFNRFYRNNFISGGDEAYSRPRLSVNYWSENFWEDDIGIIPFYFVSKRCIPFTQIPIILPLDFIRIDWQPASEPYEINGGI